MNEPANTARHYVTALELAELETPTGADPAPGVAVSVLNEVDVQLEIRLGRSSLKVKDLLALGTGANLTLDQRLDEDVEVVLNGKVVAVGALVAVDDHFGVQITRTFVSGG